MLKIVTMIGLTVMLAACDMNQVAAPASEAGDARNDLDEQDPNIKS